MLVMELQYDRGPNFHDQNVMKNIERLCRHNIL